MTDGKSDSPQSKGGRARARKLTTDEKKEIARAGASARWGGSLPMATHQGSFKVGDIEVACANLPNKVRLLTQASFLRALGRARSPKAGTGVLTTVDGTPFFLQAEALKPFMSDKLMKSTTPIFFLEKSGKRSVGYDAELLPEVAEVYLRLRDHFLATRASVPKQYAHIIHACDVMVRGLARVGVIALVDAATGYEEDRAKDELAKVLEAYVAEEMRPWVKRFPNDFFREVYRLHGWEYKSESQARPSNIGHFINRYIYKPLPHVVLPRLRELNPVLPETGRRRAKHTQFLTEETGVPHLDKQIVSVVALMRASESKEEFKRLFERAFSAQTTLSLPIEDAKD